MSETLLDRNLWPWIMGVMVFFFSTQWVQPRFGWIAAALFGCVSISGIWGWAYEYNKYRELHPWDLTNIRLFAADSIAKLYIVLIPLMVFSRNRWGLRLIGEIACAHFVIFNSLYAFYQYVSGCGDNECSGLLTNPSVSMGAMVCMLPICVRFIRYQWWVVGMASVAVFISQSSVAIVLLGLYFGYLAVSRLRKYKVALSVGCLLICLLAGRMALGREMFNDSDRFKVWKLMLSAWSDTSVPILGKSNLVFGLGLGTYHVFSRSMQRADDSVAGQMWWNTTHNDWINMLMVCGIVGLLLMIATYLTAIFKLWKEKEWQFLGSLLLFGAYMMVDPALHDPVPALFGAWAFVYALRQKTTFEEYV